MVSHACTKMTINGQSTTTRPSSSMCYNRRDPPRRIFGTGAHIGLRQTGCDLDAYNRVHIHQGDACDVDDMGSLELGYST